MEIYNQLINLGSTRQLHRIKILPDNYDRKKERDSIPSTISECYIPLRKIRFEKQYNQLYQNNITKLMSQFSAWKKSRGDGNCYYRSVTTSFLIKLFFYKTPDHKIQEFLQKLVEIYQSNMYMKFNPEILNFYHEINNLFETRKTNDYSKIRSFEIIHEKLQIVQFDQQAILISRIISHYTLVMNSQKYAEYLLEGEYECLLANIMEMGREAESHELHFLPEGLNIEVTQINIFDTLLKNHYPEEDQTGTKLKVSIISKSKGHYDCLYSIAELESEGYNLRERAYYY